MKTVNAQTITETIAHLCIDANRNLPKDVAAALHQAEETEPFAPAKDLLSLLTKNEQIARTTQMPICQDTGMAVVFADVGQDVHIAGDFAEAVNEGVRRGYVEGLLRKSVVGDPLRRVNTGDNTPAVLHTRLVPGDTLTLTVAPKGFGSENMSQLRMLTPASGIDGVKHFVLDTVRAAGANPCPPMVLGIGIGGGTIIGLSKLMLNTSDIDKIQELALGGQVGHIDLRVGDISEKPLPGLNLEVTASNFGKASSRASCEDKAAGIVHMVIESICQTAALISQGTNMKDFILIGALTNFPECEAVCGMIKTLFPDLNFYVPKDGEYGTAIGTALAEKCCLKHIAG